MLLGRAMMEALSLNQNIFRHGRCGMAVACGRNKKCIS
jgi:hypothetical protein